MTDASVTAEKLLQVGAVQLRPNEPYTWASGWKSPIYCDNRKVLSHPYIRDYIKSELCNVVFEKFAEAEIVAGVATAGIPWGAMIADQLKLPFVYVRPKPKEHGLGNQIEGEIKKGQKAIILEDLISTGKSSLQVVDLLRQIDVEVVGMVSIFTYGFPEAELAFANAKLPLHSLTSFPDLVEIGLKQGLFPKEQLEILLKWQQSPSTWTGVE